MGRGQVFGLNIGDSLEIYDLDSRSWKMSGCLFTGDFAKSWAPLPRSGMMRNGRIYAQATWAPRTGGKESGLWPTACSQGARSEGQIKQMKKKVQDGELTIEEAELMIGGSLTPARMKPFPTPHANCHTGAGKRGTGGMNIQTALLNCETMDIQSNKSNANSPAVMWPTPTVQDSKGKEKSPSQKHKINELAIKVYQESNAVMNYPTPVASGKLNGGTRDFQILQNLKDCGQITEDERRSMSAGNGGQLNAEFVEWLMNYPKGWTELD